MTRPLPVPDESSAGYWTAAAQHVLALAKCSQCGTFAHPPDVVCAACGSTSPGYAFTPVSGDGVVRSWTVMHQSFVPGFEADLPFVLVDVELDVQPDLRLIGRLLDGPDTQLRVGARVAIAFEDVADGNAIPAFTLVEPT